MLQRRQLGKTNIKVSPVALGCWPIAGMTSLNVNDQDSLATIAAGLDAGINFIDTAYCYGANGESERLIGKAVKDCRDQVVIASKSGIHWNTNGQKQNNARPERIKQECDESLTRLGIDFIDLHYLHAADPEVPIKESAQAFAELITAGKIRNAGASNLNVNQSEEFQTVCPLAAVQPYYNMLQRGIEADVIPWCLQHNVSVVNYWPLMKGLLAGKIRRGHAFDPADNRLLYDVFQGEKFAYAQDLLDGLDMIARDVGRTVSQIVINWTMHQPGITSTLCGAKRAWQIQETAGAMGWRLDDESFSRIDAILAKNPNLADGIGI